MATVNCTKCDQPISLQDRAAGDRIPCPGCGQQVVVPSPFTAAPPGRTPSDCEDDGWDMPRRRSVDTVSAKERVMAPAAALLATSVIGAAMNVIFVFGGAVIALVTLGEERWDLEDWLEEGGFLFFFNLIAACSSIAGAVLVIIGARRMANLTAYGLVVVACFVAMVPLLSPCLLMGLPVGIWALIVLNRADVKAAFR